MKFWAQTPANVYEARLQAGYDQQEIGDACGIHRDDIARAEDGTEPMHGSDWRRMLDKCEERVRKFKADAS